MLNVTDARYGETTDPELMEKFYEGDDYALELLVRRLRSSLLHQAYRQLPARHVARRQVAEDIVQTTWIKVAATRDRRHVRWDRSRGSIRTWMGTILRNAIVSYLRSRASRQMVTVDLAWEGDNGTFETAESRLVDHRLESEAMARHTEDLRQRLVEAVSRLPEKVRSILYMKLDGLSHQQIAGRLGLSKSTIGYHFREAKQLLRAEALAA
ncbi:MAG: RNA polymerase sigma factor [Planctomycetota bacterium]|nr:RNA polymerase sigma factor [Planctomycetota bacterium]